MATSDENDSPRGRIYLMRAVNEERLAVDSPAFRSHIDRCLGCRACESACPAGVQYGQLLEAARAEIVDARPKPKGTHRLLKFVLRHVWLQPRRLRAAFALARIVRDSGLSRLVLRTNLAHSISPQLEFALGLLEGSRATNGTRESVEIAASRAPQTAAMLFAGCVTEGLFARVNRATERVLRVNGCAGGKPDEQVCCGALHAHAGDLEGARKLARQNIDAFAGEAPIITNAGGCGAMLASYGQLLAGDPSYADRARNFSSRVRDVGQQLEQLGFRNGADIGVERTTYDASCHLLHGQRAAEASLGILWAIPGLNFAHLNGSDVCCGGAGVYNLVQPELSAEILDEKLANIEQSGAKVVATGNPGCHMQIAAGASLAGIPLRVCHPVELLDESYARAGYYDKS